jgi:hypothetical protein
MKKKKKKIVRPRKRLLLPRKARPKVVRPKKKVLRREAPKKKRSIKRAPSAGVARPKKKPPESWTQVAARIQRRRLAVEREIRATIPSPQERAKLAEQAARERFAREFPFAAFLVGPDISKTLLEVKRFLPILEGQIEITESAETRAILMATRDRYWADIKSLRAIAETRVSVTPEQNAVELAVRARKRGRLDAEYRQIAMLTGFSPNQIYSWGMSPPSLGTPVAA